MALKVLGGGTGRTVASSGNRKQGGRLDLKKNSGLKKNAVVPSNRSADVSKSINRNSIQNNRSSGPGGTSYSYGAPSGSYAGTVEPSIPTEEDYLKGDATYQATLSALTKQLQNFNTDIDEQRKRRDLDYNEALKDLGYIAPTEGGADPTWNWNDALTASGRSYQNLLNDFAARGNLQSSAYADSLNDLTRSLNDQYTGINDANTQFNTDLDRQVARAKEENTAAAQAARAEAIMRRAAQYGFGV